MNTTIPNIERRVVIHAPLGKDAALIETMLRHQAIETRTCHSLEDLLSETERGAAAILLTEEALAVGGRALATYISCQPTWSDLPVLMLTHRGADSPVVTGALRTLGNVTLLERPVRVQALYSAVQSALRARHRQYQMRDHIEEREESNRRKDQFLATLAHELRNPLAPIRNGLYVLQRATSGRDDTIIPVCDMMGRQVDHLVRLVDDLMEVSRITRGKIDLRKIDTDLKSVVSSAVETSRPAIEAAHHQFSMRMPTEPLPVNADPVRLAQVFANILQNAAKYTDQGGKISIDARRDGGTAVVTVGDNGIGIPAEALSRIFDMFMQADPHDSRAQSGLGIGLTLARSLVELHGGSITAFSGGSGCGSEFTVRLPLVKGTDVGHATRRGSVGGFKGSLRILVVDDNADAAESMSALLRLLGAEVRVAHDGPAALKIASQFRPALALLDLGMPGMDGYELAERIRASFDPVPMLVALTGRGQKRDRHLSAAAGFDHHLIKPADIDAIEQIIADASKHLHRAEKSAADRSENGGPALSAQSVVGRG